MKFKKLTRKSLIIIFLFLFVLFSYYFYKAPYYSESKEAYENFKGDSSLLSPPISPEYYAAYPSGGESVVVEIPFNKPTNISGFSVFFKGNLHSTSSYLPIDFDVFIKSEDGESDYLVERITNNRSSVYKLITDSNKTIVGYKLVIHKAAYEENVKISDLKFYKLEKPSFAEKFFFILKSLNNKGIISYTLYSIVFFILLFIPGYTVSFLLRKRVSFLKSFNRTISFYPIIPLIFLTVISVLFIFTRVDLFFYLYYIFFFISLYFFIKYKIYLDFSKKDLFPFFVVGFVVTVVNLLQAQRDFVFGLNYAEHYIDRLEFIPIRGGYYGYHADNTLQWGIARSLLHGVSSFSEEAEKYRLGQSAIAVFDRTPLLPVILVPILKLFGESHFIYQRFLNILLSFYYTAVYSMLIVFFNKRIAKLVLILILLSVPLTYHTFNVEIYFKYFSMFPAFLAICLYKLKKVKYRFFIIGILFAISFFIHPMNLFFIFILLIIYLFKYKISVTFIKNSLVSILPTFLLLGGWLLVSGYIKNKHNVSGEENLYLQRVLNFKLEYLINKILNLINLFIPDVKMKNVNLARGIIEGYLPIFLRYSLIALVTPVIFVFGLFSLKVKDIMKNWESTLFGIGPIVVFLLLLHEYSTGNTALFYPFVLPFILGIILSKIIKLENRKRLIILLSYPLFMIISLYYFSGIFNQIFYRSFSIHLVFIAILISYLILFYLLIKYEW